MAVQSNVGDDSGWRPGGWRPGGCWAGFGAGEESEEGQLIQH